MGRKVWNKEETFKLIEKYKNYPELWNIRHHFYRNQKKKVKVLRSLANTFKTTEDEIKRKLHNLRSQYLQEKKRGSRLTYWPFYKSLKFIRTGMRATKVQLVDEDTDEDSDDENDNNTLLYNVEASYADEPFVKKEPIEPIEETITYEPPLEIIDIKNVLVNHDEKDNEESRFQDITYMDLTSQEEISSENEKKNDITNHLEEPNGHEPHKKRKRSLKETVLRKALKFMEKSPDEHQIFGDYVANELRNIKSIQVQKELKRIIQQNIVAMSEKDDKLNGYGGRLQK